LRGCKIARDLNPNNNLTKKKVSNCPLLGPENVKKEYPGISWIQTQETNGGAQNLK
jgi:hypothetical protein